MLKCMFDIVDTNNAQVVSSCEKLSLRKEIYGFEISFVHKNPAQKHVEYWPCHKKTFKFYNMRKG